MNGKFPQRYISMNFIVAQFGFLTDFTAISLDTLCLGLSPSLSLEARLVRAIREALNWSGRTGGRGPSSLPPSLSSPAAGTMAISSRAELSQMEDEQITRIKKEGGRIGGGLLLSGINGGSIARIADSLNSLGQRKEPLVKAP